jgi:prepilin-type N-terminal cleavage/methylation domain-containing protein
MNRKGFTLVEIMIVVAIIALLAAIAIPNLLRARLQANESAAQAALKTLATAQVTYRTANVNYGTLLELGNATPAYIDQVLRDGTKSGYAFEVTDVGIATPDQFQASGVPQTPNVTGVRSFCITEDGVVRVQPLGGAIADRDACLALGASQP